MNAPEAIASGRALPVPEPVETPGPAAGEKSVDYLNRRAIEIYREIQEVIGYTVATTAAMFSTYEALKIASDVIAPSIAPILARKVAA